MYYFFKNRLLRAIAYSFIVVMLVAPDTKAKMKNTTYHTFPNGLIWIHRQVKHNQIVAFHLFFPGGATKEKDSHAGITRLMGSVMFKGTARRTALDIAQQAESLGASLGVDSEEDFWKMDGQVTVDMFAPAFDIFMDILLRPSFPLDEFKKEKQAHLNSIRTNKEHIFNTAYERMQKEVFSRHAYARPEDGTEESVSSLTQKDLMAWHRKSINPKGAVFVTVGNLPRKKLKLFLEKAFRNWHFSQAEETLSLPVQYPDRSKTAEEHHDFEQSYLMTAFPAPAVSDKDYAAVKVLNAMLGSGMSSPLFQVVREQAHLAYEVSSFYPSRRWGSAFVIYAGTDPRNLELAHDKVKNLLADFIQKPVSEEDLQNTKQFIRGHFMMSHQTNDRMAWYLGWWEILGKGYAYDNVYVRDIEAVQRQDVKRVAKKIFNQPNIVVKIRPKNN